MSRSETHDGRTLSHLRFSKKLALALISGVLLLFVSVISVTHWIEDQHDRLAQDSALRMMRGGMIALEEKLAGITRDYSTWTEAYENIRARNVGWIYSNLATSVTENGTIDVMVIMPPDGGMSLGWVPGMGTEPADNLLPPALVDQARRAIAAVPVADNHPVTFYALDGDALWLLSVTRVVPWEGLPPGTTDSDLPRNLFGFRLTDALVQRIGREFLIDDVMIAHAELPEHAHLDLLDGVGQAVGQLHWTPPTPGDQILGQIALPLGAALAVFAAIAALACYHLVHAAQRLERTLVAAQAADRAKTEFLANVTHELRTPMNGIIGIAQLLEHAGLSADQAEMLRVLNGAAQDQMALINGLLDVARIESGRRELDEAPFEPAFIAGQVLKTLEPVAARKGLALAHDLGEAAGVTVLGDTEAFRQIANNLIGNAIKFTREGSVRVTLGMSQRLDRARVTLVVADTGPGIAAADQARIFRRFVQLDGSKTRESGGTGLGLAITKSLVELMDGEIRVDSAPGKGATFTVAVEFEIAAADAEQRNAA